MKVPVLLIGFNRPDVIEQNVQRILSVHPSKLYIAIDGPRPGRTDDIENVQKVRDVVKNIQFDGEIHYLLHEENLGCNGNVTSGISWVLEKEEYVIVVEDDVMTSKSFFSFLEDMLIRYKDEENIAMVSGCNYHPISLPNNEDYCFAQTGHIWGWGTWKKQWSKFSLNMEIKDSDISIEHLRKVSANEDIAQCRQKSYRKLKSRKRETVSWDVLYACFRMINGYLSIVPACHLTSNIGTQGTHTGGTGSYHFQQINDDFVAQKHPNKIVWCKDYDIEQFNCRPKVTLLSRIIGRLKRLFIK